MTATGISSKIITAAGHAEEHAEHVEHEDHAAEVISHQGHSHSGSDEFWPEFWELMGSPAHWAFELVTSVVFYLVFGLIFYRLILKNVMPRFRKTIDEKIVDLHEELDREHGYEHLDNTLTNKASKKN